MSACPWDKLSREPIRAPPSKRKLNGKNWVGRRRCLFVAPQADIGPIADWQVSIANTREADLRLNDRLPISLHFVPGGLYERAFNFKF